MIIGRWNYNMSVLEIVLYSLICVGVLIYIVHGIIQIAKNKKKQENGETNENKDEED